MLAPVDSIYDRKREQSQSLFFLRGCAHYQSEQYSRKTCDPRRENSNGQENRQRRWPVNIPAALSRLLRYLPFAAGLLAVALVFKSCDGGKTEETKRTSNALETTGEDDDSATDEPSSADPDYPD